jgi:hypothetical protein
MKKKPISPTEQLRALIKRAGLTSSDVARQLGYKSASGFQRYIDPDEFEDGIPMEMVLRLAPIIAERGESRINFLEILHLAPGGGEDFKRALAMYTETQEYAIHAGHEEKRRLDVEQSDSITEIDVYGGLGGGGEAGTSSVPGGDGGSITTDDVRAQWHLPEYYLRSSLRVDVKQARIIEVLGDSMEPTLKSGDRVMLDLRDKRPTPPGLFALWDGIGVVVKRLDHIPNTDPPMLNIKSENKEHDDYERTIEEITIIGRVIWYARRL